MPANQYFDQKHLQDVVLAQSKEIRPAGRFSSPEIVTRPLLVLTAIVAIVAIFLGVKNYVEPRKATPPASTSTPVVEHSKVVTRTKKTTSAKAERTRVSATDANASAATDDTEKSLIGAYAGAKAKAATENGADALSAQAGDDEVEAAMDGSIRVGNEGERIGGPAFSECLPLPNGTLPGDVDAPYYFRWAGEYCGRDLLAPRAKVPESQKLKR